jgi:hypothetical protein
MQLVENTVLQRSRMQPTSDQHSGPQSDIAAAHPSAAEHVHTAQFVFSATCGVHVRTGGFFGGGTLGGVGIPKGGGLGLGITDGGIDGGELIGG